MLKYTKKLLVPCLLALGIVTTFTREIAIAYYFGSGRNVEIYKISFAIPYAFFQSLGSILIGGLLPILLNIGSENIGVIEKKIYLFFFAFFVLLIISVGLQADYLAPGFSDQEKKLVEVNLILSWTIVLCSALIFPKRLAFQANSKNLLVSSTSLIFSSSFILFIFFGHQVLTGINLSLFSIFSALIVYMFFLFFKPNSNRKKLKKIFEREYTRKIYLIIINSIFYIFLLSIPRAIDRAFGTHQGVGVVANLDYAMNFYIAIGVLIGTTFNILQAKKIASEYNQSQQFIQWVGSLLIVPIGLSVMIIGIFIPNIGQLIELTYHRGAFSVSSVNEVSIILYWFLMALPFMVAGMVISQVLAALNIVYLNFVMIIKIAIKYYFFITYLNDLSLFGKSTIAMEVIGFFIMLFITIAMRKKLVI
jgi:peptidoglycan biosynthesis protein MviN/MurJ (putative lipid II flippase)